MNLGVFLGEVGLFPTLLVDELGGDEDSHLADGAGGDLPQLQPPSQLSHEGQDQLLVGGILLPGHAEHPPEDPHHTLLQGVVEPPAGDDEGHEDFCEPLELSSVITEPAEVPQVDLHELLGAEEKTGGCRSRVREQAG